MAFILMSPPLSLSMHPLFSSVFWLKDYWLPSCVIPASAEWRGDLANSHYGGHPFRMHCCEHRLVELVHSRVGFIGNPQKGQTEHLSQVASSSAKWWLSIFCWTKALVWDRNRSSLPLCESWLWRISTLYGDFDWMGCVRDPSAWILNSFIRLVVGGPPLSRSYCNTNAMRSAIDWCLKVSICVSMRDVVIVASMILVFSVKNEASCFFSFHVFSL